MNFVAHCWNQLGVHPHPDPAGCALTEGVASREQEEDDAPGPNGRKVQSPCLPSFIDIKPPRDLQYDPGWLVLSPVARKFLSETARRLEPNGCEVMKAAAQDLKSGAPARSSLKTFSST